MVKDIQEQQVADLLNEPIAIIGMNCQFPGIDADIEEINAFFQMLLGQQTPITEVPQNRWDIKQYFDVDKEKPDKTTARKGGFLKDPQLFDAAFFKISAIEAKQMDPQQRLFLEVAIRALNHANIVLESLDHSDTGVFCGISTQEYGQLNYKDRIEFNAYTLIGTANSAISGRLSHYLNLKGPSLTVDTACSSSLSALYLAVMALRNRECSLAIAGGVHFNLCPESFIGLSKANMLSTRGQCSSFDIQADGYARSEGCGVIVVKRLSDALKDKDTIHAVIRSIVMNQDGDDGKSLVAPNIKAQIAMHHAALAAAGLKAADLDYIEAHGTGTVVGDAVEFNAIKEVHQGQHTPENPLIIGALKSNLGHCLSASGVASLIKAVCALSHECIPANLHYKTPNGTIEPQAIPAVFPLTAVPYQQNHKKRYAQITNFGFTGTNVSVIIEEAPPAVETAVNAEKQEYCFVLSAKSESSLQHMLTDFIAYLEKSSASLHDICATLMNCRDHYKFRCAIIAANKKELSEKIKTRQYNLSKVTVSKELRTLDEAAHLCQAYLSGKNIRFGLLYNKADLPLYHFDRQPYWHEVRQPLTSQQWANHADEPIAIIGMSCRYPKASNIEELFALLERGESGMMDIPLERWDNENFYDSDVEAPGKLYIKQLGLIEPIKKFDAEFFNISPREAKMMSPPLRVFLETSYHALEDANLPLHAIKNSKTGVFVGCATHNYPHLLWRKGFQYDDLNMYFATGNALNAIPGRVAYSFDFHGPIQAIDTACSSSMTAIHNACMSLKSGDCDMALAGGVNIILTPESCITLSKAKMLSPESRCKTFSKDADGYARSEGCGIIVLKRLSNALADQDRILAVIEGSAINSDGRGEGFTVPNPILQEEVIRTALTRAKCTPAEIDFVEAHGTGTPVADPIEANTLVKVFGDSHSQEKPLYISSVKTNIGHSESAAGVAGVIKAVLSLQTQRLFKHLNFDSLNPNIKLKNTLIPLETVDCSRTNSLRYAGVSSFGVSGANAHLILQRGPTAPRQGVRVLPAESLLVLSAKSKKALELLLGSYQNYLTTTSEEFADICYTAAVCRSHFLFRVAIIASSAQEAAQCIAQNQYTIYQVKKEHHSKQQFTTLEELRDAYLLGFIIPWGTFYQALNIPLMKVKLPLYEFSREEYWFYGVDEANQEPLPDDWSFQLQWQTQTIDHHHHQTSGKNWLLLGEKHWANSFEQLGLNIIDDQENYPSEQLEGIIFAKPLTVAPEDMEAQIEWQKDLLKELLALLKKLNAQQAAPRLIVLTHQACAELASQKFNLSNAAFVGFCKTLVLELPQFKTILIDLESAHSEEFAPVVIEEIKHNHHERYEPYVAYRQAKRWVCRVQAITLPSSPRALSGEGCYLITGGAGGLGRVTAEALIAAGAREVILVSRNVDSAALKETIAKIHHQYPGCTLRVVSLDICNKELLQGLLQELNSQGQLKGIIHAAGAAVSASLLEHEENDVDALFAAKVKGGWYLHELSQTLNLDFFVVYSSIASVFGSNKESVYSATNSFIDALIAERVRLGLPGAAIQWGPWGEAGMAKARAKGSLKHTLISNTQGLHFIKKLLLSPIQHLAIISPDYLQFMLDFVPQPLPGFYRDLADKLIPSEPKEKRDTISGEGTSSWLSSYFALEPGQRSMACRTLVQQICSAILERPALDGDEGFYDLGFDSLMMTELVVRLRKKLEPVLKITVNVGFDYPTINKLAVFIEAELAVHAATQTKPQPVLPSAADEAIAIIGMSCNFPGAPDIQSFEQMLEQGLNGIKDIPLGRWDNSKYYDPEGGLGKSYVNKLGLVDEIKCFDAQFFGISPREAKMLSPQQRIFLECSYTALEHANYPPSRLQGSLTGVFAGVGPNEYYIELVKSGLSYEDLGMFSITGNANNVIPGRVAYAFDLQGPSISVDTACSSSLVAIHYACQSLKNGDIDYALAGGVNILLRPESNVTLCQAKALSPDGQCKTFDAQANGYVRSEGCGVVFLKRLADALRDRDTILAVIRASAVNNDGKSAGLTVPNGKSQEAVMRQALKQSGLSGEAISYFEAHGTGTPLGDPVEVRAINSVYGHRSHENPLYLGAVKTNIGHLESAAGVASLIKTVISLQRRKIYKHLHLQQLNPNIDLQQAQIPQQTLDWLSLGQRFAAINAFGFSGTNAHMIVQEFPEPMKADKRSDGGKSLLVLSAKTPTALNHLIHHYQEYLQRTTAAFSDICYTAATGREHYMHRLALVAETAFEASQLLKEGRFACSNTPSVTTHEDGKCATLMAHYLQGGAIDWQGYYQNINQEFTKVTLPNYVFDKELFWPDKKSPSLTSDIRPLHPLLGQRFSLPGDEYLFVNHLDLDNLGYIKQHQVFDTVIYPATAYIEAGLAAAKTLMNSNALCLEHFLIERPFKPQPQQEMQLRVKAAKGQSYKINIFAQQDDRWHSLAEMSSVPITVPAPETMDLNTLKSSLGEKMDLSQIYKQLAQRFLCYGPEFQVLQEGYIKEGQALTRIAISKASPLDGYIFHPVLLDGAMQSILLFGLEHIDKHHTYVPFSMHRMTVFQEAPPTFWAHLRKRPPIHPQELAVDIAFYNQTGHLFAEIKDLRFRKITRHHFLIQEPLLQHVYATSWEQMQAVIPKPLALPEFLVIAEDEKNAVMRLSGVNYQLLPHSKGLDTRNRYIIYFYEQSAFNDLFHLCQKMFQAPPAAFILVTQNAYAVRGDDKVNPYHTMASAFWKSFKNEFEHAGIYTVDVDEQSVLLNVVHYIVAQGDEHFLALRDMLYLPRLKNTALVFNEPQHDELFDRSGSYLITGGTGALGILLLKYLMQRGVKHIFISSRSPCPASLGTLIEEARTQHIFITHVQADASNYQQMETLISTIQQTAPLKGLFHLAGQLHDGLIVNLNEDEVQAVLNVKMHSALILHQLTKSIPLQHFVLFSSTASVLGARGQANYAAANGFLDGLAYMRHSQGLPAAAINWGPFAEVGMAATLSHAMRQHGFIPLDKEDLRLLDVLLDVRQPQIILCPINWPLYFKSMPKQEWLTGLVPSRLPQKSHFLNSLRLLDKEGQLELLKQTLREITANVLGLHDANLLTDQSGLFSLGLDSLMALDIRNKIYDRLQCPELSLSIEYFINEPSIEKIARHIIAALDSLKSNKEEVHHASLRAPDIIAHPVAVGDFQFIFWAINKFGYEFNIGMRVQIQGKFNKDYAAQAFEYTIKRHSAFWLCFHQEIPQQQLQREGKFHLFYQDVSLNDEAVNLLPAEFQKNILSYISLAQPPLIRVFLYKINQDLHELHLVIPHIIVDDTSCDLVFSEFKSCYEQLAAGKDLPFVPAEGAFLNYLQLNNNHYEKNLQAKSDFWQAYNRGFKMLSLGRQRHLQDAAEQEKNLFHFPLHTPSVEQFIAWHKEKNINVSSGLVAACHIVFYKLSQQNKIPVILIHSGREGSHYKEVVGLFSQYKRINLTLEDEYQFIDCLHEVEKQLERTAAYQSCSHFIKNKGLSEVHVGFGYYWELFWNKFTLSKKFRKAKLHPLIVEVYLEYLSWAISQRKKIVRQFKLNQFLKRNVPLQKPERLRILLSITPSFFRKEIREQKFADVHYSFPGHFDCMDRPVGNQTLWVYFSKSQYGEYQFSINGPLTAQCKEEIARELNKLIGKIGKGGSDTVAQLIAKPSS